MTTAKVYYIALKTTLFFLCLLKNYPQIKTFEFICSINCRSNPAFSKLQFAPEDTPITQYFISR